MIYDHSLALLCCAALERTGFATVRATSLEQALQALSAGPFAAVLLGRFVPHEHGRAVVAAAHARRIPCVAMFSGGLPLPVFADARVDVAEGEDAIVRVLCQQLRGESDTTDGTGS